MEFGSDQFSKLPYLFTVEEAASALRKSPQAMREAMCRSRAAWAVWLRARRIRLGRRYYFLQTDIIRVMEKGDEVSGDRTVVLSLNRRGKV